ncbi:MAG: transposase [Ramlibacter sp.]|nr:transposase [Ramlibacter sp.]
MTWLTARELAGLPGMPGSERRTRDKLAQLQVPIRSRAGRGGGQEYDCTALPAETRQALMIDKIAQAVSVVAAHAETASPESAPVNLPVPVGARRPPSQADKAVADARVMLIARLEELAGMQGTKRSASLLSLQLASGQASAELLATARTANQRPRDASVSQRTLLRWLSTHRTQGWWGLLPAQADASAIEVGDDVAAVLGRYHSKDARYRNLSAAAMEVNTELGNEPDAWRNLYARARRALPKVNRVDLIKARHSGAERAAKLPFKRRDTSVLKPLDVWLIDGHTFKAKVRHPDHGAPFAPEVTVVKDAATRMICGWSVALSENVIAVGDALRHAVGRCGTPAIVYSDNGAGETAKQMDCPVTGIIARLGADHRTGIAGHPQGHGLIERGWRTHMINCARQFGSYQGKDVDSNTLRKVSAELAKEQRAIRRAETTGEVIQLSHKAPTWKQFIDAVQAAVDKYNHEHRHRSLPKNGQGKHMTPAEAWAAMLDPSLQHKLGELELRMLFMPAVLRTAKRGEVTFLNQTYFSNDLMSVDGEQVRVHYDIHDPAFVMVFTTDGEFVCEARWNANRIDYFPKPVVQMAREKRVAAAVKRREGQIELAQRELQGTYSPANVFALPEPSAPVVVVPPLEVSVSSLPLLLPPGAQPVQTAAGRPFFDAPSERYEWLMRHRDDWSSDDAAWISGYVQGEDYEGLRDYFTSRGMDWNDEAAGFKSAR